MTVNARFCPRCAAELPDRPPVRCTSCGYQLFVNARPTGTAIILRHRQQGREFLAVRRAREPRVDWWDLPGGFCDGWEHPADTAVREVREELGLEIRLDEFVGMYVGTYDYQQESLPVLDHFWLATMVSGDIVLDRSEATSYAWLSLAAAPELAFPTMDRAIEDVRTGLVQRHSGQ